MQFKNAIAVLLILVFVFGECPEKVDSQSRVCESVSSESITVSMSTESIADPTTLGPGEVVEYVGQTPDGVYWILRYAGGYALYATSEPDLRPEGCEVARWGAPSPDYRPLAEVMTAIGVDAWHEAGYYGQGVRVGVIDTRFDGLDELLATAALDATQITLLQPLENLTQVSPEATGTAPYHGTNVLEVLTAIAPQAEYVIAQAASAEQFQAAVDGLIAADVHIIVHAGNVITSDPGPYHDAVRRATAANILWVNSAGNIGAGYYPGRFSGGGGLLPLHQFEDPNRSGLQQGLMVPVNREGPVSVTVLWEDDRTAQVVNDFDLVVSGNCRLDATGTFQPLSSDNNQATSEAEPRERVVLTSGELAQIGDYLAVPSVGVQQACPGSAQPDGIADNEIYISLLDSGRSATVDTRFDVYVEGALPAAYDPDIARSLDPVVLPPGDIPESLTVGAYDPRTNQMAWYSGRYNSLQYYTINRDVDYSLDEIVKPDIVTYGELLLPTGQRFFGTSAATPVVGGVAAILGSSLYSNGQPDFGILRELLSTQHNRCLDNDGSVTHVLRYLKLDPPGFSDDTRATCSQYGWTDDLSTAFVTNYKSPVIAGLETESTELSRLATSRRVASLDTDGNVEHRLLLGVEAFKLADTYEARRAIFSVISSVYVGPSGYQLYNVDLAPGFKIINFMQDQYALGFTPNNNQLVTITPENLLALWDLSNNYPYLIKTIGSGDSIQIGTLSPDGNLIAVGELDGDVVLYDIESGIAKLSFPTVLNEGEDFHAIWLNKTNHYLVVETTQRFFLWNLSTAELSVPPVQKTSQSDMQIDQQGRIYLVAWQETTVTIVDFVTRNTLFRASLSNSGRPVVSPDGRYVAVPTQDGTVSLWNIETQAVKSFEFDHDLLLHSSQIFVPFSDNTNLDVVFSPDSTILVLYAYSRTEHRAGIVIWDAVTGEVLGEPISAVTSENNLPYFSPDNNILFGADCWIESESSQGEMQPQDCISPQLHPWLISEKDYFRYLPVYGETPVVSAYSSDGRYFVTEVDYGDTHLTALWERTSGDYSLWEFVTTIPFDGPMLHPGNSAQIHISPDLKMVSWPSSNGTYLWKFEEDVLYPLSGGTSTLAWGGTSNLVFSPDSSILASVDSNCDVSVYRTSEVELFVQLAQPFELEQPSCGLKFSPYGQFLAQSLESWTENFESRTVIWDLSTLERPEWIFDGTVLAWIENGDTLVTRKRGESLLYWDMATGNLLRSIPDIGDRDRTAASNDGSIYAGTSGNSLNQIVTMWDLERGQVLGVPLDDISGYAWNLAFSPNNQVLVVSSEYGYTTFFDVAAQKKLGDVPILNSAYQFMFSEDGQTLLAFDGQNLFSMDVGWTSLMDRICRIVNRNFTQEEWQLYFPDEPYRETCDLEKVSSSSGYGSPFSHSVNSEVSHTVILQELSLAFAYPMDWEVPFRRDEIFWQLRRPVKKGWMSRGHRQFS
ncbi:S8 family serine peptidase [Aggregatilinea lenta]|uniref:S8 family serine peptidase n=1 Tax=Aggregatilinea lenta TaxID=913108 RepID=UPI0013C2C10F|nr:S8 family serine peptidase [Aggregatilinea lenta]